MHTTQQLTSSLCKINLVSTGRICSSFLSSNSPESNYMSPGGDFFPPPKTCICNVIITCSVGVACVGSVELCYICVVIQRIL
jgi:hypothetical protein